MVNLGIDASTLHAAGLLLVAVPAPAAARPTTTGRVLVQFRLQLTPGQPVASAASGPAYAKLPGMSLQNWVGIDPARSDSSSGLVSGAAATPAMAAPGTVGVFTITDGSSLQQKISQLRSHPGKPSLLCIALVHVGWRPGAA